MYDDVAGLDEVTIVTRPSADQLNQRQQIDYESVRKRCLGWLLAVGKEPDKADGYALGTVKPRSQRMDQFYRWVWDNEERYTTDITHDHADQWLRVLAGSDAGNVHKSNCRKALLMLYKWREYECGYDPWEPDLSFPSDGGTTQPRDYLTREERRSIREAALEYGSIPGYSDLTPSGRDRWRAYLAQRFDKPKNEVTPNDWTRANGWKTPSLVWTSLDAGLRPIEVSRAVVSWVDVENRVLRIPKEQSSKNRDNWIVGIRQQTADYLNRWLDERAVHPKYENTDALWLTRHRNPYDSSSLRYLLHKLCEIAEIPIENRQMSWYSIRHSLGTYMTREEDLAATQAQLRHKRPETTMKYDQAPVEDRQNALERID
ncbi:tyrosine-type recombinase/integrase [Natrialbaceae archaeon A-CW1-1]